MKDRVPDFLMSPNRPNHENSGGHAGGLGFIDKGIASASALIKDTYLQWESAQKSGMLQRLDARVKLVSAVTFIVAISLKNNAMVLLIAALCAIVLAFASRVNMKAYLWRLFGITFFFGVLMALPAALNVVTKGEAILPLLTFSKPKLIFGIYEIPAVVGISMEGVHVGLRLCLRVCASSSIALLLIYTTTLHEIMAALRIFRAPEAAILTVTLSFRYIYTLCSHVEDMHLALKSRMASRVKGKAGREIMASRAAALFRRAQSTCAEIYNAMITRCAAAGIRMNNPSPLKAVDYAAVLAALLTLVLIHEA